jgi:putative transposase
MVYIDLNMVRAGVVNHPAKWKESGFSEIEKPPKRYATIDLPNLMKLSGFADLGDFQRTHRDWVEQALNVTRAQRNVRWSEAVAVGSLAFVEKVKGELGARAIHREFDPVDGGYVLREPTGFYARRFTGENETLSSENTLLG